MKRISAAEENLKKTSTSSSPAKAFAISKQVLKSNPIPQKVNLISDTTVKPKAQPLRSSKVSQKLVLFPQSTEPDSTLAVLPEDHDENTEPIATITYEASPLSPDLQ
ncbi:unnamed protein product [Cunninghamella echinulata]